MKNGPMTFEPFQATGRDEEHLEDVFPEYRFADDTPGRTYLIDTFFVIDMQPNVDGRWYTVIENHEFQSDDLEVIERKLHQFVLAEGGWDE